MLKEAKTLLYDFFEGKKGSTGVKPNQAAETKVLGLCFLSISDAFNTGGRDCLNVSEPC